MKTYTSPWERAMKGNEELVATMKPQMPGPYSYKELQKYKNFNRCLTALLISTFIEYTFNCVVSVHYLSLNVPRSAMPFGGFDKAAQLMTFQLPDIEVAAEETEPAVVYQHDISSRPSFNRTPIGWGGSVEPGNIHMELDAIPFDGETDDL